MGNALFGAGIGNVFNALDEKFEGSSVRHGSYKRVKEGEKVTPLLVIRPKKLFVGEEILKKTC